MSETTQTTTDTRPWGDRSAASGVESLFLWAKGEIQALHDKLATSAPAAEELVQNAKAIAESAALATKQEIASLHQRIDDLIAQVNTPPAPPPPNPVAPLSAEVAEKPAIEPAKEPAASGGSAQGASQ